MPSFKRAPLLDLSPEDFIMAYEINTKSAFLCAKSVVLAMKSHGKGSIINIGSISGRGTKKERADIAVYGCAKAAVMNLTLHMAHQWGRKYASTASPRALSTRLGRRVLIDRSWHRKR